MKSHACRCGAITLRSVSGRGVGICRRVYAAPTQGPKVPPLAPLNQVRFLNFGLTFLLLGSFLQWLLPYTLFLVAGCQVVRPRRWQHSLQAGVSIARPGVVLRKKERGDQGPDTHPSIA